MPQALHLISRRGDDHLRFAGQQVLWTPVVQKAVESVKPEADAPAASHAVKHGKDRGQRPGRAYRSFPGSVHRVGNDLRRCA